jgi:hypothetical protein
MAKRGLDGRSQNQDGRIREKSGASKIRNLAKEYPELKAFTPGATLGGIKARHKLQSLDEVRALGAKRLRQRKG